MPVSNNGANIRLIIYWKGLEDTITVTSPMDLGGLKSPEYLKLNPQGKMPLLVLPDGIALPESAVIANYIADKYASSGPSLIPSTQEARATANLATRVHDIYIASGLQGCMYKSMDIEERAAKIAELAKQLDVLEGIVEGSPYIVGDTPSLADAALFPTFVFFTYILPSQFGWTDVFASRPKLKAWWEHMCKDDCGKRVHGEVLGGLEAWAANDRWNKLGIAEQVKDTNYKWEY
ncbi:hypothetical protein CYMTET_2986 [Cymbomonas tetramitiformis]|uniref:Glutathione S-transferase n=1 Tax=Cymbomonas tetramitiformis TaxID=36881 RepID=A0AAE0LLJ3_9CHLO|nr:hypothetical protein CYMTET_2986 [Cymbomonas tetramitiformis]